MVHRLFLRVIVVCAVSVAPLVAPSLLRAQSSDGTLVGTVTDQSDSAVPNVTVKAVSAQYGAPREVKTDAVGTYRIENLQPGIYSVTFTAPGFADLVVGNVILRGSVTTTADGKLEIGSISKTITVEATAAQTIDTQSGTLGESLGKEEIESLPYASFNPAELALTLPGVQDTESNNSFSNGISYSVNGTRPRANNFLIDGQDDNDQGIGGQAFQPSNVGAIQEFTVLTNSYGAEYGRGGGSVANYIYKSGTNSYHGQAWEIANNSAFAAIPAQNLFLGATTIPLLVENTFGFDVGGPVKKDKLFFFASVQWDRIRQRADGAQTTIPTAAGISTLQSLLPNPNVQLLLNSLGTLVSSGNISPSCVPLGNGRPCVQSDLFQFTGVPVASNDRQQYYRADWHLGPNDVLTGAYIRDDSALSPDFFANPGALPQFETQQGGPSQLFRGQWTHIFSSSVANVVRFSYTNIGFSFSPTAATLAGPLANIPEIDFGSDSNYPSLGVNSAFPQGRFHKTTQVQESLSYSFGKHSIKGGADVTFLSIKDEVPFNSRGDITYAKGGTFTTGCPPTTSCVFSSLGNFVDDFTGGSPGGISKVFGNPTVTPNVTLYAPYIQDTWRVRDNLSFDLGLRYEYWGTVQNTLQFPAADPSLTFGLAGATFPGSFGFQQRGDRNNFGPRIGVAYTPHWGERFFGHDKTVIRAGYGIFYDGLFANIVDNTAASSPNATGATLVPGAGRGIPNAMAALAGIVGTPDPTAFISTIPANLKNPMTQQWNLNVQRELPAKMVVTAAYVGTKGTDLFVNQDLNGGIGGFDSSGNIIRGNPNFGEVELRSNAARSRYDSAQLEVERRFRTDLTVRGSYTFSKYLDDGSEVFATTTSNLTSFAQVLNCQKCDWGPSTYDRRHRFNVSYVWAMPYAKGNWLLKALTDRWQWSGIATIESGSPDTVFDGFDNIGNGHPNTRPDIGNASLPITSAGIDGVQLGLTTTPGTFFDIQQCFNGNTCTPQSANNFHFIIPAALGPGTVGRNSVYGPGQWFFDTSIERKFPIPVGKLENQSLTFRTEFFNAFNHPNLFTQNFDLLSPLYAQTAPTISGGRVIKFWLRYEF